MKYEFSDKVKNLKPSAIREIFKYAADPQVISLAAGSPSSETFPVDSIREISNNILNKTPFKALEYSVTEGYMPLRDKLKSYMFLEHKVGKDFDDVIITSGAQQVADLLTKATCNEGDIIICEDPSFVGALNTFRSYNTKLKSVSIEDDGINIEMLEQILKKEKNIRFIYTIPNFQNPSGVTMSLEKRKVLYSLAKKYSILIFEDNPYGDLRYKGEHIPDIKSFDSDGLVVYAGSFSKVLSPGMRVGYSIAPKEITQKMVVCKQVSDVHTNILSQMIAYEFMENYAFNSHLEYLRKFYKQKLEFTICLLDKFLKPKGVNYTCPDGGLFIWCSLPASINMMDFCERAISNKVCVVPGSAFLVNENDNSNFFRINFSCPSNEQLEKGIQLLSKTLDKVNKND